MQARRLKAGDQLLSRFASAARIQMLEVGRSICRVYNMQVEHLQAYAVGESAVLVHNKPAPNNEELPEPELPEGVGEAFADPADAIGDLQGQATHVGSGKTNPAQPSGQFWIDRGYTETHYFVDSNGDKWTLFFNRDTGLLFRWPSLFRTINNARYSGTHKAVERVLQSGSGDSWGERD